MNNQHVGHLMFFCVPTRSLIALAIKLHSSWLWKQSLAAAALCSIKTRQRQIKDIDLNNAALTDSHSSLLSCRHTSHPVARKWVMCLFWQILRLVASESFAAPHPRCQCTTITYLHEGVSAFAHSAALQWRGGPAPVGALTLRLTFNQAVAQLVRNFMMCRVEVTSPKAWSPGRPVLSALSCSRFCPVTRVPDSVSRCFSFLERLLCAQCQVSSSLSRK